MTLEVYASDAVRDHDPIINYLPSIIDENPNGPVYFVSPVDLVNGMRALGTPEAEQEADLLDRYFQRDISIVEYLRSTYDKSKSIRSAATRLFLETEFPEIAPEFDGEAIETFHDVIFRNRFLAGPYDGDIASSENTRGFVFLEHPSLKAETGLAYYGSTIYGENDLHITGNDLDWRAITIFHEISHLLQGSDTNKLRGEVVSDIYAKNMFDNPPDIPSLNGVYNFDQWPQIAKEWQHWRAIASITTSAEAHITNAPIQSDGELAPPGSSESFQEARGFVVELLEETLVTNELEADQYNAFLTAFRNKGTDAFGSLSGIFGYNAEGTPSIGEMFSSQPLSTEDLMVVDEMLANPDRIFELSDSLSVNGQLAFEGMLDDYREERSEDALLRSNVSTIYQNMRDLYQGGVFANNLHANVYAYEFLVGVQNVMSGVIPDQLDVKEVFPEPVEAPDPVVVPVGQPSDIKVIGPDGAP